MNLLDVVWRVCDIETVGFKPIEGGICEIAYMDVAADGTVLGSFETLIKTQAEMSEGAFKTHGISDEMLEDAPLWAEVEPQLLAGSNLVYVAHNKQFESAWLPALSPWVCTLQMARMLMPDLEGHALQFLRTALNLDDDAGLLPTANAHRAAPDVAWTAALLRKLLPLAMDRWKHCYTVSELNSQLGNPVRLKFCPFGKFRGQRFDELEYGMLKWIVDKSAGGEDCVYTAKEVIKERFAKK